MELSLVKWNGGVWSYWDQSVYNIINIRTDDSFLHMWGETSVLTLFPVLWQRKRVGYFLAPSAVPGQQSCVSTSCPAIAAPSAATEFVVTAPPPPTLPLFTRLDISPQGFFNPN